MSTRVHAIPLHHAFIPAVAGELESYAVKKKIPLSRIAVCFRGERPALFLNQHLAKKTQRAFFPPRYFTMDSFVDYLLQHSGGYKRLSELDACFLIYTIVQSIAPELVKGQRFASFLPWAREIMAFIDHVDQEALSYEKSLIIEKQGALGYDVPETIGVLLESIHRIRSHYHEYMKRELTYAQGFRYMQVAENLKTMPDLEFDAIFFCGFHFIHETEIRIMHHWYDAKKAVLFFQGDQAEWPVLKMLGDRMGITISCPEARREQLPRMTFYEGFDTHSQVSLVRTILHDVPMNEQTVIVLPQPRHVIPLLSELSLDLAECNVSMGYPLERSSLFALFELIIKAQETRKDERYYVRDYIAVLRHPLVKNLLIHQDRAVTRIIVHKIEECLLGMEPSALGGQLFVSISEVLSSAEVRNACARALGETASSDDSTVVLELLHRVGFSLWESVKTCGSFIGAMEEFLDTILHKSDLEHYPLNASIMSRLCGILSEFGSAQLRDEEFDPLDLFSIFEQYARTIKVPFKGTPLKGLQILGSLETRALSFTHVIIMDMNEGVIPQSTRFMPLIPRDIMIAMGLKRYEVEEEIHRYHFMAMIEGAEDVFLVYNNSSDHEKSRFIHALEWQEKKAAKEKTSAIKGIPTVRGIYPVSVQNGVRDIPKRAFAVEYLREQFTFSASSINTYLECPARFYYTYVLRMKEKEIILDEPEAQEIGTFIHDLLEKALTPFVGKKPLWDQAFEMKFFQLFERSFEERFSRTMKSDSFMLKEIMKRRLMSWLEFERTRPVAKIKGLEKAFVQSLSCGKETIRFTAKIDRIDVLDNGTQLVLDYKTGGSVHIPIVAEKLQGAVLSKERTVLRKCIRSFQMPLYILMVMNEGATSVDAALYHLRDTSMDYFSIKVKETYPFSIVLTSVMKALSTLIEEMFDPAIPFVHDTKSPHCAVCQFRSMCGI